MEIFLYFYVFQRITFYRLQAHLSSNQSNPCPLGYAKIFAVAGDDLQLALFSQGFEFPFVIN